MNDSVTPLKMRGESSITLGDVEYKLRATFRSMIGIEERCKADVLTIIKDVSAHKISVAVTTSIFYELARAGGSKFTLIEAGELVVKHGVTNVLLPMMTLLMSTVTAGTSAEATTDPS